MAQSERIEQAGLNKCDFDHECDFCKTPEEGTYAMISNTECGPEALWYMCGKCASKVLETHEDFYNVNP